MSKKFHIPEVMRSVVIDKTSGLLTVRTLNVPVPGPGEVLVKIAAAPVNPSDLAAVRRALKDAGQEIFIPGLEGSGTVVSAGKGFLPDLWLGKRVACSAGIHGQGSWAEYMVTRAGLCFPLRDKVSDEQGSMSLVNPLTAIEFMEIVRKNGHRAIISNAAASALGRMVELLAEKAGIPVINIVRSKENADKLRSLGSRYVLDSSDPGFTEDLEKLSGDLDATVLFDPVSGDRLDEMIMALPKGSSVVIYGNLTLAERIHISPRSLIDRDIRITGFYLANKSTQNGLFRNMLNIMKVGRLMSREMKVKIAAAYPLESAQLAVDSYLNNMSAGKILLKP